LFSFLQTNERLEGAAMILAIAFSGALALQESFASNFAVFVNSNLAEVCGPMIAIATLLIVRTIDPVWNAKRMMRSVRRSISTLYQTDPSKSEAWLLQVFDRIGMAAERLAVANAADGDLLRDTRVGLNLIALRNLRNAFGSTIDRAVHDLALSIGKFYEATLSNTSAKASAPLLEEIRSLGITLEHLPQSEERLSGITAVMGLRLDLDDALFVGVAT